MKQLNKIHFVGIGGIGMCGIAEVMLNQGYSVSGSDIAANDNISRLQAAGARIEIGHHENNIQAAEVLVTSSAIADDNPEVVQAIQQGIPVVPRAEMLSELMRTKLGIAISGTHGKTTTTSLVASVLDFAHRQPTYVIGGRLLHNDKTANLGRGECFVAEADESDGSFLSFHPMLSVVTNIDNDHLEVYKNDLTNLVDSFKRFISDIPFYGCAILCIDDLHIRQLIPDIHRRIMTYGFDHQAMLRCVSMQQDHLGLQMHVVSHAHDIDEYFSMRLYGRHNALNGLACIGVGIELGLSVEQIKLGLANFQGIARRFNSYLRCVDASRRITVIDDYGHHPTEIRNTIDTMIEVFGKRRIIFVFEPHRYTRVKALFDQFTEVLLKADYQIVLPIYVASETQSLGVSSSLLCDALRGLGAHHAYAVEDPKALFKVLEQIVRHDDMVLFMGAGDIGQIAQQYLQEETDEIHD